MCPYAFKKINKERNEEMIYCNKQENTICHLVYFCKSKNSWKPIRDTQNNCLIRLRTSIPDGFNKVRFEKRGKLYVDIGNKTIMVDNPFDYVPDYVALRKVKNSNKFIVNKSKTSK